MSRRPTPSNPLQRSLFDEWFGVAAAVPPQVPDIVQDALVAAPVPTITPQPKLPAPASPHDREIIIDGRSVAYRLRRARRSSIGFVIGADGLSVSAPRWVGTREIESALREKGAWIQRKLREQHERAQAQQAARIDWRDGAGVPFLGDTVVVLLDARGTGVLLDNGADAADALPGVPRRLLRVALPHTATPEQIRDAVQSWLQRQARRVFDERCALYGPRLGVNVRRISLSSAATRWGSASADGAIRLNWRLVHFALPIIDYVVAHELAHLREMNHSAAFWKVVGSVLPDYQHARHALREHTLPIFD
jgi:predicted metal-dependent hydrolase